MKPPSYNGTVFDNRSPFTGEKTQYTTFASSADAITDTFHVIEMEENYDCSKTELKTHMKSKI